MKPFGDFPTSDFEVISPDGEIRCRSKGIFGAKGIMVFDDQLMIFPGDEVRRRLPNGSDETFEVVDPTFNEAFHGIPAHFNVKVRRKGSYPHHQGGHFNISITGANARVNIGSTDNSTNHATTTTVFGDLTAAIKAGVPEAQQEPLLRTVRDMEKANGTAGFSEAYKRFITSAAEHMAIIGPFLPALSGLL